MGSVPCPSRCPLPFPAGEGLRKPQPFPSLLALPLSGSPILMSSAHRVPWAAFPPSLAVRADPQPLPALTSLWVTPGMSSEGTPAGGRETSEGWESDQADGVLPAVALDWPAPGSCRDGPWGQFPRWPHQHVPRPLRKASRPHPPLLTCLPRWCTVCSPGIRPAQKCPLWAFPPILNGSPGNHPH